MKYRLTETEKAARRADRAAAREARGSRVETMRQWVQARRELAQKRAKEAKGRAVGSRGVDRVPERYRVHQPAPITLTRETPAPRRAHRSSYHPPRRRDLMAVAVGGLTDRGRKVLETEMAKADKTGAPMTVRQITARAWALRA